ncbi:GGDEF domain-containing protein [Aneurinibacillus migulanus]|uniref:GGDEF domain-containing protein n=1 Tax=Aneurinibacillus migulanus TaxID=47500 RepID=UPI001F18CB47|nr:GGDEF domain-containing protein [Aneurinibacillus migulanus]
MLNEWTAKNMKCNGRIVSVIIILINSIIWNVSHWSSYKSVHVDVFHLAATFVYIAIGWYLGKKYDEAKFYSEKDPLTNTYNRRFMNRIFPKLIAEVRKNKKLLHVFVIDINDFKRINDTYGHETGDQVLEYISGLLRKATRKEDMIIRIGGDEFVILIPSTQKIEAITLPRHFKCHLHNSVSPFTIHISISIGHATYPEAGETLSELIQSADKSMYEYKVQQKINV